MDKARNAKKDLSYWLNTSIVIFLMFFFGRLIEPWGAITPVGMQVLGIFLGLIWGWSIIEILWPSLMGMLALGMSDYMTMAQAMQEGFGNSCVLLVFFCLIFAAYLDSTGINKIIAYWFIGRKICIGRPWVFSFMLLAAAYVLGFAVSLFAAILLCWSLFYSICKITDIKPGESYAVAMIIGLCYAACLGVSILAFKPIPVIVFSTLETYLGLSVNYLKFAASTFFISFPCLIAYWAVIKYILKPDVSKLTERVAEIADKSVDKITLEQKIAFIILAIFFLLLFLPGILPKENIICQALNKLTTNGIVALMILLTCVIKINGKKLTDFSAIAKNGVVWDLILVFVAIMPLSTAMASESTGILAQVISLADRIFVNMSSVIFSIILIVLISLCSQVIYNVVVATVFTPIMCTYAVKFGASPEALAVLMCFAMGMALCTPAASGMAAMMYGNKKWLTQKQVLKYTLVIFGIDLVSLLTLGLLTTGIMF